MTPTKSTQSNSDAQLHNKSSLVAQYGKIGISAVAAAIRYQGKFRKSAAAPAFAYETD